MAAHAITPIVYTDRWVDEPSLHARLLNQAGYAMCTSIVRRTTEPGLPACTLALTRRRDRRILPRSPA